MLEFGFCFHYFKKEIMSKKKIKKYFSNNLHYGDFVRFPSGQRYKILSDGRAFPVCSSVDCRKQAQGRMCDLIFNIRIFVQPFLGREKLYLYCTACFAKLSLVEIEQIKEEKARTRNERKTRSDENKAKRLQLKGANICKLIKIN